MKVLKILLFLLSTNFLVSQNDEGIEICFQLQNYVNEFTSDKDAELALDKILFTIGASKNFVLVPCEKISNAVAITYKGERYILYDKNFISEISRNTNEYSGLFILAHEVGHHVNGHTRDFLLSNVLDSESLEKQRNDELEADEFAAFIVTKLGASLNEINEVINLIGSDKNDLFSTHPERDKRLIAVKNGYDNAESQKEVIVVDANSNKISSSNISDSYNSALAYNSKDRLPPNERKGKKILIGKTTNVQKFSLWEKHSTKDLEDWLNNFPEILNDPFKLEDAYKQRADLRVNSFTKGQPLGDGSQNLQLYINQTKHKVKPMEFEFADKYDPYNFDIYSEYRKYGFQDHHFFRIFINNFLEMPKYPIGDKLNRKYANFEYLFDNGVKGYITVGLYGWTDANYIDEGSSEVFTSKESYPWPSEIDLTENLHLSKHHFKSIITFFNNLKTANTLFLRMSEVFSFNGYSDEQKKIFDTSKLSYEFPITFKFDLKRSSKGLSLSY